MSRLCLYYRIEPRRDRWLPGDRYLRPIARRLLRGPRRPSGVDKVFINLCAGLDRAGIPYVVNLPFRALATDDRVAVLGRGRYSLEGYDRANPIVAGIALMTHPSEWPTLCEDYPVVRYLQHSHWANEVYRPYFGDRCEIWPVGIDTDAWAPTPHVPKSTDVLIYDKIRWDRERYERLMLQPLRARLHSDGNRVEELRYGHYSPRELRQALQRSRSVIFLVEHESQGIAAQECLSSGVPMLVWDPGECLDPARFAWGQPHIPATSVPYWDERCGMKFRGPDALPDVLPEFLERVSAGAFDPRSYILEHLTLQASARRFVAITERAAAVAEATPA